MLLPDSLLSSSAEIIIITVIIIMIIIIIITVRFYDMGIDNEPERQKYVKGS